MFLPLITITGVTGTFFSALAITMSVALLTSLVLALVWTSNLSTRLIRRGQASHEPAPFIRTRRTRYRRLRHGSARRATAADDGGRGRVDDGGFFGRILRSTSGRCGARSRIRSRSACCASCSIVASYACYRALGSDLLPAIDEGGFVLDYVMPAGSSLQETDRVLASIEAILRATPEVESTSRRTGLELGLAAVTEPNTGDIAVKLKARSQPRRRRRDHRRAREGQRRREPGLDVEFIQVLQDMIGDLTGAPEPVVVKLFSPDPDLLATWAPQVAEALEK